MIEHRDVDRRDEGHVSCDLVNSARLEDVAMHGEKQEQASDGHVKADAHATSERGSIGP